MPSARQVATLMVLCFDRLNTVCSCCLRSYLYQVLMYEADKKHLRGFYACLSSSILAFIISSHHKGHPGEEAQLR